ncbi:MAG TPA: rhomboid family intramembrane serine protease [Acidobacteriaceae bacterium]|nr:rhomboid family intramembrane serine protease [Acidobacteriaceae bacterium]
MSSNPQNPDVVYAQGHAHEPASAVAARAGEVTRGGGPQVRKRPWPSLIAAYPATSILMAINLLVFAAMFRWSPIIPLWKAHQFGSILTAQFDGNVLYYFGGCDDWVAIGGGQWWRLVTACFVHASILHIATNLWCLWNLGLFGEPLLGRWGLAWVYLLTGVTGNLLSAAASIITRTDAIAVGASGAIFGIAGILIVLLSNRKLNLPWEELKNLRRQVILFAVINLALGIAPQFSPSLTAAEWAKLHVNPGNIPHIDNSAHLGGLLSGLALGVPLLPKMTTGKASYRARQRATFAAAALILSLVGYALSRYARG